MKINFFLKKKKKIIYFSIQNYFYLIYRIVLIWNYYFKFNFVNFVI